MLAFETFDADISTQSYNQPLITSAGVWLFQADDISQAQFQYHNITVIFESQDFK
jgi:hypothetical protein